MNNQSETKLEKMMQGRHWQTAQAIVDNFIDDYEGALKIINDGAYIIFLDHNEFVAQWMEDNHVPQVARRHLSFDSILYSERTAGRTLLATGDGERIVEVFY